MFMGEYHHNIDEKGRLVIPSIFREKLGKNFIITKGIEKCLQIFTEKDWEKIVGNLNTLPFTKKDARTFTRFLFSSAAVCEFDKSGRINITSPLVSYAGLLKECLIIGVNDHLEIWDVKNYEEFLECNEEEISTVAENLFSGDDYAL